MFLSKFLINLCMIMHCVLKENIFAIIISRLLVQEKYENVKNCFRINGKQMIKMFERGQYLKFRNFERKLKHHL